MTQAVNYYHIAQLLGPLAILSDDEREEIWRSVDPNREDDVRPVIRKHVVPAFEALTDESQVRVENALRYFLTVGAPWEDLFEMFLPPFDPPDDPRRFFLWLWSELTGKPFTPLDVPEFAVNNDLFDRSLKSRDTKPS